MKCETVDSLKQRAETDGAPEACWVWTGATHNHGYGVVRHAGRLWKAHRLILHLLGVPLSSEDVVMHTCDNPPCINPNHLRVGTQQDNLADMRLKGRGQRGERNGQSKVTEAQVREARELWEKGASNAELCERYGVSKAAVSRIVNGVDWGWVK